MTAVIKGKTYKVIRKPVGSWLSNGEVVRVDAIDNSGTVFWRNDERQCGTFDNKWNVEQGQYELIK